MRAYETIQSRKSDIGTVNEDGPHEFPPFFLVGVAITWMVPCKVLVFPIPLVEYLWSQFRNQKKVPCSVY